MHMCVEAFLFQVQGSCGQPCNSLQCGFLSMPPHLIETADKLALGRRRRGSSCCAVCTQG